MSTDPFRLSAFLHNAVDDSPKSTLEELFEEEPVPLDVFITDKKFMGIPPLTPIQFDAVRHAERIFFKSTYELMAEGYGGYWAEPVRMVNFLNLQWGKGGGKGHICRASSLRVAYLLLCLRDPLKYFNMPSHDYIHLLNVASNARQAQDAFFKPVKSLVARSPWFKDKCEPTVNMIAYAKNIQAISGHSDADSQEGLNLLLGVVDEVDAFRTKDEAQAKISGREPTNTIDNILNMMKSSSLSRFPYTFKNLRISFPRYKGSMIQRLTHDSKKDVEKRGDASTHYFSGPHKTWEVRPGFDQEGFITVGEDVIPNIPSMIEEYEKDPIEARAKYECRPAAAANPYFRNEFAVRGAFKGEEDQIQPIEVSYKRDGDSWKPVYKFSDDFYPIRGAIYAMHGDLAITNDRAGIAMAHVVKKEEFEEMITNSDGSEYVLRELRPIVKVDFVLSYEADKTSNPPREIQIRWARELCFELKKRGFRIKKFTFDGFESRDSMQILERAGIESDKVSTDRTIEPWRNLRDVMHDGRMEAPYRKHVIDEILALNLQPNGKVDHPYLGSKDEADALACAVYGAVELGGQEHESGERGEYQRAEFGLGPLVDLPLGMSHSIMKEIFRDSQSMGL